MKAGEGDAGGGEKGARKVVSCFGCGEHYSPGRWAELPSLKTLTGQDMSPYVVAWPNGSVVEVRSCGVCRRPIARRRSVG